MSSRAELMSDTASAMTRVMYGFRYAFGRSMRTKKTTLLQTQALGLIRTMPHSSPKEIGDALYLSSSAVTQLVQRLSDADLIARDNDPEDRRAIKLSLTKKGEAILWEFGKSNAEKYYSIFGALSDEELRALSSILTKLHNVIQEQKNNEE